MGLIDNWLRNIKDIYQQHRADLEKMPTETQRADRLCELNVAAQVYNVCHTTIVQNAWKRGQPLAVHGWIYGLQNGLLKDLNVMVSSQEETAQVYRTKW
jgi:carbonic anhydrase